MNTDRIAYFLAVAQTGSITLGAQKSFITQTAMSQQMAALEAELGLQRRQLLHDEKPLSFLNVPVQGRHSGCSSQLCEKYTILLSKTQTSIQEGGYKDFLYYFRMKMRGASK